MAAIHVSAPCAAGSVTYMSTQLEDRPATDQDANLGDAWTVVVLDDDDNSFEGVAACISAVIPDKTFEDGLQHATQVHFEGRSMVWSGHQEVAEHYHGLLSRAGLTMAPLR